jgi:hypothetical protein
MTKKAETLEIPQLIQFLNQELHDLPDQRKPGNNTRYIRNKLRYRTECQGKRKKVFRRIEEK